MKSFDIEKIKGLLESPRKISIIPHRNPDGDAYGSSLALYKYLKKNGHSVQVISPNEPPEFLNWLPGAAEVVIFDRDTEQASQIIRESEMIFILDFNALHRVGEEMESVLKTAQATFIMIDHHPEPDDFADFMYSDTKVCSTCQMLYQFFEMLDEVSAIDTEMASCIYTGILTDTGSFRFSSTTAKTHLVAADLLNRGVEPDIIYNRIFENTESRLQLLGKALNNLKVVKKYRTAYITLSNKELRKYNYQKGDTEGFVNYALSLKDVVLAAIFIEDQQQGIIKISFRSKGDFSVNELARKYFNGGGHVNAAGGRTHKTLTETVHRFIDILPEYEDQLSKDYEA